jgi:hypothetical protein
VYYPFPFLLLLLLKLLITRIKIEHAIQIFKQRLVRAQKIVQMLRKKQKLVILNNKIIGQLKKKI